MLKISEMAKLADTTRRTLIFYDEQAIFKPAKKTEAGYRYYEYDQLYDLMIILGLRNLGLSLEEIKNTKAQSGPTLENELIKTQTRLNNKITELQRIQKVINQKIESNTVTDESSLYQPSVEIRGKSRFWCSRKTVSCTEEEIAQLFSYFYKQLDSLSVMDTGTSGFLTDLSLNDPNGYATASFRIIKKTS